MSRILAVAALLAAAVLLTVYAFQTRGPVHPAHAAASGPAPSGSGPSATGPSVKARQCHATVRVLRSWPGGFQGEAVIANTGSVPLNEWYVSWMVPLNARLTYSWNGSWMQSGPSAMIHAATWNKVLKPGASERATFQGWGPEPSISDVNCG